MHAFTLKNTFGSYTIPFLPFSPLCFSFFVVLLGGRGLFRFGLLWVLALFFFFLSLRFSLFVWVFSFVSLGFGWVLFFFFFLSFLKITLPGDRGAEG